MNSSNSREVAVVIPVKDRIESLFRALESVDSQTIEVSEIIVVDDGSKVSLVDVIKEKYPHVKYLRNETSRGAAYSRNRGWRESEATYVAFLDSDDEFKPDCLQYKIAKLKEENIDLVTGSFDLNEGGKVRPQKFKLKGVDKLRNHLLNNSLFDARSSTIVVRRDLIDYVSFDESLRKHQDWDLFINVDHKFKTGFTNRCDAILHIEANDRISTNLQHESTKYFVEKNAGKISADALFLFLLKMLYKSDIRSDRYGVRLYKKLILDNAKKVSLKYSALVFLLRLNLLNIKLAHKLKKILGR